MAEDRNYIPNEEEVFDYIKEIVTNDYENMKGKEKCAMCKDYKDAVSDMELFDGCTTPICKDCMNAVERSLKQGVSALLRPALESKNLQYLAVVRELLLDPELLMWDVRGELDDHIYDVYFERNVKGGQK